MQGIDITALPIRRQFNLVQTWLSNEYGEQLVKDELAAPTPTPLETRAAPEKPKKMQSRRMTKEQAEQIARDLAEYDASATKGRL